MSASSLTSSAHHSGLLLMRIILGVVFMFHGSQKLFGLFGGPGLEGFAGFLGTLGVPLPMLNAILASVAEFGGGLLLLVGLGTRLVAVPLVITMLIAAFKVHGGAFSAQASGLEYPLTLGLVTAGLGLTGAGAFSLDHVFALAWQLKPVANRIEPRRATQQA
ncbi:MAG TPA: DoxX family protein [Pirellulaceae bacterium]|nr:DoxX family protein [Pirellulaceae bacterium]